VIETRRSHTLGRVIWEGASQPDSGEPEGDRQRVLRAPADGFLKSMKGIGEHVEEGEVIAMINDKYSIASPFPGVLRGLLHDGLYAPKDMKIGDVDPRDDPAICYLVSDKALAIGGGVLEAILSRREIREKLFR
jgi:xanthine dehydrogenase accessory factor